MSNKTKLIYGVGINDADYQLHHKVEGKTYGCPFYRRWRDMIKRCYDENTRHNNSAYDGCSVVKHWHIFSNFKKWMETKDWEDKHLDKDILFPGNKIYSPETCVFISGSLNMFLTDSAKARGKYPIGVSYAANMSKYESRCNNPFINKKELVGYFKCPNQAHIAWKNRKHELACMYAEEQTDPRIVEALKTRYA